MGESAPMVAPFGTHLECYECARARLCVVSIVALAAPAVSGSAMEAFFETFRLLVFSFVDVAAFVLALDEANIGTETFRRRLPLLAALFRMPDFWASAMPALLGDDARAQTALLEQTIRDAPRRAPRPSAFRAARHAAAAFIQDAVLVVAARNRAAAVADARVN